jgi:hypothetical protein
MSKSLISDMSISTIELDVDTEQGTAIRDFGVRSLLPVFIAKGVSGMLCS